jgi:hypothetical protein
VVGWTAAAVGVEAVGVEALGLAELEADAVAP